MAPSFSFWEWGGRMKTNKTIRRKSDSPVIDPAVLTVNSVETALMMVLARAEYVARNVRALHGAIDDLVNRLGPESPITMMPLECLLEDSMLCDVDEMEKFLPKLEKVIRALL